MEKRRSTQIVVGVFICLIVYTLVGFLLLPLIVKPILTDKLSQFLQREVAIETVRINPYSLSLTIRDLEVKTEEKSEILASWSEFYVNLQSLSSLVNRALVIKELYLREPFLRIERDSNGDLNVLSLFPKTEGENSHRDNNSKPNVQEEGRNEKGLAVRMDLVEMVGGGMLFFDNSRPEPFQTEIRPISLSLINLNTTGDGVADFSLSLKSEIEEEIAVKGKLSLNPFISRGNAAIKGLSAKKYAPYYRDAIAFDIEKGTLTVSTDYDYDGSNDQAAVSLDNLSLSLRDMLLRKESMDFLTVDTFTIEETGINFNEKTIDIGMISTSEGTLSLVRDSDGTLNVSTLVPPADGEENVEKEGDSESPWIVTVKTLSTDGYTVTFEDRSTSQPALVKFENISIEGENISTAEESRGSLRLDLQEEMGGGFSTEGTIGVNPLYVDLSLKLSDFHITPFQPYVSEAADLIIQKGSVSTEGTLTVEEGEDAFSLTLKTDVALSDFSSADSAKGEDFFNFASLSVDNLNLRYNPNSLAMGEISLSDFYAKIIINPDETLNVGEIFRGEKDESEPPAVQEAGGKDDPFFERMDLGTVRLKKGRINFTDRLIKPNYTADLYEIEGSISGLTSEEAARADVDLTGKLDKTIPLTIKGTTNPLKEDFFADLTIEFKNIELGPLTPYSQKHLGYPIDKGKLFLNLEYIIDKRSISSENKIFIDQFTLGEPVESPDAINLPVKLAISLLQNRKGEIDLDVPVSGSLDDPEFSVGYFIVKIIGNIIEKAVTSPFALIGGLAGGGEELGYAEFDYGSATITDEVAEKLDKLDEALYSRPLLKLEIEGHADTLGDGTILKKALLDNKIKSAKLRDDARKGLPSISLEEIVIVPEEYETYLAMAYKEEGLPEPEGDKKVEEMEKGLSDTITVTDDDLRQLAYQRASVIRDYIIASGKVEKERIFLLEPKSLMPENRENIKDSRVDFQLK
ncbi:MAG: DUF748 domain-containing protein [Deltaproteobacteria bacterium]|nr:DUF748 domain-containing protein [Deltaproteobacteria bacterium]MBN2846614.1 DUF748 domain-containing protein [Deltaproteobacteria bacterium]